MPLPLSRFCWIIIRKRGQICSLGLRNNITFAYSGSLVTYGTVSHNGMCWMDRNLGASGVATAYNDSNAYGDLFQWDGLPTDIKSEPAARPLLFPVQIIPGTEFIYGMGSPYDWRSPQNNNLWQELQASITLVLQVGGYRQMPNGQRKVEAGVLRTITALLPAL